MLVDLSDENMTLDQCLTRVKNTGLRVAALIHQTVDYRLPMRWWATETVKSPQLSLNTMAYYCILCYIFSQVCSLYFFLIFAHLWWFGGWVLGLGFLGWALGFSFWGWRF